VSDRPAWTIQPPPVRVEPSPRWIRVRAGRVEIANSRRALLLAWYGPGKLPTYCLPAADVRTDALRAHDGPAREAFLVPHDIATDDGVVVGAAHLFRAPPAPLEALADHWTFDWDGGLAWFEEALEVQVHARDPSKRVDVLPSERHVRVEVDGELVAESRRPHALFETTLPTRWYFPLDDVRQELLVDSDTMTRARTRARRRIGPCASGTRCTGTSPGPTESPCRSALGSPAWWPSSTRRSTS
jgi:uncharacterized protein (DUF427 family)